MPSRVLHTPDSETYFVDDRRSRTTSLGLGFGLAPALARAKRFEPIRAHVETPGDQTSQYLTLEGSGGVYLQTGTPNECKYGYSATPAW
jgi:hypothetical protein